MVTEEKDFLRTQELRLFQDHASPNLRTFFLCAILTGMRQGELLALHWDCIDFASMQIRVRRGLYKGAFIEPKSASSRRDIDMAPMLAQALRESPSRFAGDLVFPQANGKPMNPNNLRSREFKPTLRRAGLRDLPFHSLRDSYAALMIHAGHHPKYIQAQMGHASIRMTLDLYGHLMEETNPAASVKLQETFLEEPKLQESGHKMVTEKPAAN